ncbi:MAG: glycosyltransferase family 2 protein [Thermodesulfovibrionales bacterium]|nr:glycosyltransferase family 2 protein [Thermodesulfovibrionales bacterium]
MDVSIVIPVYNEEENIKPLYESLHPVLSALGKSYEMVFVDDGSSDRTMDELQGIVDQDDTVRVVSLRRNFGQTAAFAAGFDHARGDVIITMDGDNQNDPADIPMMLEKAKDFDLVSGWRKDRKDAMLLRKIPSRVANWLISTVTGVKLHDYGCSLKAYRHDVIKNLNLYGEMHRFIPAVASWYGISVTEVPVRHHARTRGASKYGISRIPRVMLDLITVKFLQSFSTKPIQFFGPTGLLSGGMGFAILMYLSVLKFMTGASIGGRPLLLLGVLLIIVGVQVIGMGLIAEMLARVYHESQKKPIYYVKKVLGAMGDRDQ